MDYEEMDIQVEQEQFVVQLNIVEGKPRMVVAGTYELDPATFAFLQSFNEEDLYSSFGALVSAMIKIMIHEEETGENVLSDFQQSNNTEHPWVEDEEDHHWSSENVGLYNAYWGEAGAGYYYPPLKPVELNFQKTEIKIG